MIQYLPQKNEKIKDEIKSIISQLERENEILINIGTEIEFYILDKGSKINFEKIFHQLKINHNLIVEKERGYNQYEVKISHTQNIFSLIQEIYNIKQILEHTFIIDNESKISFQPKPFKNEYGSGLHYHISIHKKNLHKSNLFVTDKELMESVIGSILYNTHPSLEWIFENLQSEYERLVPKFMAPINASWGKNNRTTLIRIPECCQKDKSDLRIEFRLASPITSVERIILFLLYSINNGIKSYTKPPLPIFGNAHDEIYEPYNKNSLYHYGYFIKNKT